MTIDVTKKPTILDVARHAGVSKSAVSKVLTDAYGVSPDLRRKVEEAVEALGYRPNLGARSLRGSTYTLGVILPDVGNPIFTEFLAGLNDAVETTRYSIIVGVSQLSERIERGVIDTLLDRKVDGIVYVAKRAFNDELELLAGRIPMVVIGHHSPAAQTYDTINTDDRAAVGEAVDHLVRMGRRKIVMLSVAVEPEGRLSVAAERERGYEEGMRRNGLSEDIRVVRSGVTFATYEASLMTLLAGPNRPDAIICWTDAAALAAISTARKLDVIVPDDLAVIGFDNNPTSAYAQNDLASIDQEARWMGKCAGEALLERIGGRTKPRHIQSRHTLILRGSVS